MSLDQRIIDPEEEEKEIAAKLNELENLVLEAESFRKKQFCVSAAALLLILIIMALFLVGIAAYFKNYPKKQLMSELSRNTKSMFFSSDLRELGPKFTARFLNTLQKETRTAFNQEIPTLRRELRNELKLTIAYLNSDFKAQLEQKLKMQFEFQKEKFLERYGADLSDEKYKELEKALDNANQTMLRHALSQFTLATRISPEMLLDFQAELDMYRSMKEYSALKQEPREFIESRLLENLLEYGVYLLNESKGIAPCKEVGQ